MCSLMMRWIYNYMLRYMLRYVIFFNLIDKRKAVMETQVFVKFLEYSICSVIRNVYLVIHRFWARTGQGQLVL